METLKLVTLFLSGFVFGWYTNLIIFKRIIESQNETIETQKESIELRDKSIEVKEEIIKLQENLIRNLKYSKEG